MPVILLLLLLCQTIYAKIDEYTEDKVDDYLAKTASEKENIIWNNCQENTTPAEWFGSLSLASGLFLEPMCPTFDTKGDIMPYTNWFLKDRKKYIHSVGTIGRVNWVSKGSHNYTGLFKGANHGFVRLSLAGKPTESPPRTVPGMAVKFLRDGIDSANFVAMFSLTGQPSWNFFKNNFTNHVSTPEGSSMMLHAVSYKFGTATNNINQVGLSDFAKYGNDGTEVITPIFPYMLRFHRINGTSEYPDEYRRDFLEDLKDIKKGVLYEVYALDKPVKLGGTESYIADLVLTSEMVTSNWADTRMFFRHQDMAADLLLHPEWAPYTEAWRKVDPPEIRCPYH